ncbi:MAG: DUF1365 domain-containing protein [Planctomycetes bacterium]|nr:DUF1365 domain-containing protein [Planctomycetota bacterium]
MSTVVRSGVCFGTVRHRRFDGIDHRFALRLCMYYLDLDEIDVAFAGRWFWSARRPAPVRFRRADFFGDPERPLRDEVLDAVMPALGRRPTGAVRMLTGLRCFGYSFNPVTFYYCFDDGDDGERPVAVLAEITNTPWRERHHYVVVADARGELARRFRKEFHVSPFQPMAQDYTWRFATPGDGIAVHMENHGPGGVVFDATLALQRRPWRTSTLLAAWLRHPWMSLKVIAGIHWHALRLWLRRAPFHVHPDRRART